MGRGYTIDELNNNRLYESRYSIDEPYKSGSYENTAKIYLIDEFKKSQSYDNLTRTYSTEDRQDVPTPQSSQVYGNGIAQSHSNTCEMKLSSSASFASTDCTSIVSKENAPRNERNTNRENNSYFSGQVLLSQPEDEQSLSPLRCFLRKYICAFSATPEDIAVRTPTSFPITPGQVGIACIHCYSLPPRERSNRAICFPFSVGRIYQSVADMQRFHFMNCNCVPKHLKAKFLSLHSASSKGSKGLATRQYWIAAAKKIGLVDTKAGIRFGRNPASVSSSIQSLDILAQVALNTIEKKPLVLPEDNILVADFLYIVMSQLQPCRFTEADRNKRRLKNVGFIGVECKHCSRQVDGRKFFWSSVNAVESNFVSVHTHMHKCRMIPLDVKKKLAFNCEGN